MAWFKKKTETDAEREFIAEETKLPEKFAKEATPHEARQAKIAEEVEIKRTAAIQQQQELKKEEQERLRTEMKMQEPKPSYLERIGTGKGASEKVLLEKLPPHPGEILSRKARAFGEAAAPKIAAGARATGEAAGRAGHVAAGFIPSVRKARLAAAETAKIERETADMTPSQRLEYMAEYRKMKAGVRRSELEERKQKATERYYKALREGTIRKQKMEAARRRDVLPTAMSTIKKTPFEEQAEERTEPEGRDYDAMMRPQALPSIMGDDTMAPSNRFASLFEPPSIRQETPSLETPGGAFGDLLRQPQAQQGNAFGDLLRQPPALQGSVFGDMLRQPQAQGNRFGDLLSPPQQEIRTQEPRAKGNAFGDLLAPKAGGNIFGGLLSQNQKGNRFSGLLGGYGKKSPGGRQLMGGRRGVFGNLLKPKGKKKWNLL